MFKKGQSGNPKGRPPGPTKTTLEQREFAREFLLSEAYRRSAKRRILAGEAPHLEVLVHHQAFGKPVEHHEVRQTSRIIVNLGVGPDDPDLPPAA